MVENELGSHHQRHPLISLLLILIVVGLGFIVVGPMIGFLFALPFYHGSMTELIDSLNNPSGDPGLKVPLYIIQGFATLVGLIIGPAIFLASERRKIRDFFHNRNLDLSPALVTVVLVVIFMVVNSIFIDWNASFRFPEFAKEFEVWAREKEDLAAELTKFLTTFDSEAQLLLAIIVIAVLPALGEEIVFRGIIQNELLRATRNPHVSIWFAAILFSAIHFQFFGFLPRLLLGTLFGYLYYWSGNLWFAILAHFVNNGFSVMAMYFYQQGTLEYDLETPEAAPMNMVMISTLITAGLLYFFYKYFENRKPLTHSL